MTIRFTSFFIVLLTAFTLAGSPLRAQAQSEASALSALPLASVVVAGSTASATAGALVALPVALSVGGAVLTVRAVEASARGTVLLLERASDGAQASIALAGRGLGAVSVGVGTVVTVSVVGSGVLLSVAGEALAFIPNALGRALLHNERVTH